tara:strand:- start:861 stop:1121 length:261 start_codon:yes stop_codon:yes gene_type:complete
MTTKTTQATKVATALVNGAELTAKQISARYGVKNVRAVISQLRSEGFSIYLNKRVSSFDGETYMKYMLGTPTKAVVAAGYKALRTA